MRRSAVLISTARTQRARSRTLGARSNHKDRPYLDCEPAGHGIGRPRGGLTTKIHSAVDGSGRPLANVITGGQRNDGAMLADVLADIHVPRLGRGRPRIRSDAVIADKAYSSGAIRGQLRSRAIPAVIPEKSDTIAARSRRGSRGGRAPNFDADLYKRRNVVERSFALDKQWRALGTRYDKLAITYRAAVTLCHPDLVTPNRRYAPVRRAPPECHWLTGGLHLAPWDSAARRREFRRTRPRPRRGRTRRSASLPAVCRWRTLPARPRRIRGYSHGR